MTIEAEIERSRGHSTSWARKGHPRTTTMPSKRKRDSGPPRTAEEIAADMAALQEEYKAVKAKEEQERKAAEEKRKEEQRRKTELARKCEEAKRKREAKDAEGSQNKKAGRVVAADDDNDDVQEVKPEEETCDR